MKNIFRYLLLGLFSAERYFMHIVKTICKKFIGVVNTITYLFEKYKRSKKSIFSKNETFLEPKENFISYI